MNMYKRSKLATKDIYRKRVLRAVGISAVWVSISMVIGTLGYHYICNLNWIDAQLNASMILTGMGPVDPMVGNAAKIFASSYALFSGVTFLTSIAVMLSPVLHRAMHRFHIDDTEN